MYINKKPLIINDPMTDERFRGIQWDQSIHSLLVVPLIVKSRIRGVLTVYNKKEGLKFTDDDLRLLSIIAAQSAQVVENARLNEQEKAFIRMKEELTVAAKIQAELLPTALPAIPGYDVYARTIPAASVGGDYYDVMTSGDPTVSFCVGDVSGKGMPAALLMANLQATLRAMLETHGDPGGVLQHANRLLFKSTSADKFATVFFARLNPATNELSYANAGHDPAVLMSANGSIRELPATGLPVGLFDGMAYEESTLPMEPEDILVVFSDGITECMDRTEEQFGREKIVETLAAHRGETAAQVSSALLNAVNAFSAGTPQSDDQTLLVVRRNAT
jgi:sigma-B regulation protein RsbU (phosphoserine phosphatase)